MKKLILLAVLVGLAWWYFDGSRRLTEDMIRQSYQAEREALRQFDAPLLCKRVADDFQATDTANGADGPVVKHLDKQSYCDDLTQSLSAIQQLSNMSRGRLVPEFNTEIKNITLAANRKSASVETVSTVKLGDMTLARSRGTETFIRRNGQILSTGGEFKSWAYSGE
jgi:hypothetical protein